MSPAGLTVGVVGKLPALADYAHLGARGPAFEHLLDWMLEGCETGSRPAPGGRSQAFVQRTPEGPLAGVIAPSRDAAGRIFPVVAAVPLSLERLVDCPQLLPLLLEELWVGAESLLRRLLAGAPADPPWGAAPLPERAPLQRKYDTWLREMTMQDWTELVFGTNVGGAPRALATLEAAVAPHAGQSPSTTPLSLSLPLGRAGGAAVCFWLDLLRVQLAWRGFVPSFFWSHRADEGRLIVPLGNTSPAVLSSLWGSAKSDSLCVIDEADAEWEPPALDAWRQRLGGAPHLADLLAGLAGSRSAASRHGLRRWMPWRSV